MGELGSDVELLEIIPGSDLYSPDDERWREQVALFYEQLRDGGVVVRQEGKPVPGAKGEVEDIILALGSAGVFTAALAAFRSFLSRERSRRITITWIEKGERRRVDVRGDTDNDTMERLARQAIRKST